eukprot:208473_1
MTTTTTTTTTTVREAQPFLLDMDENSYLTELDKEYQDISASVSRQISQLKTAPANKIRDIIDQIKTDLQQCNTSLREMKQEIKALDGNARDSWNNVIDRYNNDYISLKDLYEKEKESAQRKDLFGDAYDPANMGSSHEQARMIKMRNSQQDNTEVLRDAHRELNMTEKNAMDIEENLYEQRSVIEKVKANLIAGNTLLGRMGRTINTMGRRQALMKVLWCVVILILLGVISLIIYLSVK